MFIHILPEVIPVNDINSVHLPTIMLVGGLRGLVPDYANPWQKLRFDPSIG